MGFLEQSWQNQKDLWLAALSSVYQYGVQCTKERLWMAALTYVGALVQNLPEPTEDLAKGLNACKAVMAALDCTDFPEFSVTGRDVMAFGISGPDIGRVLNQTRAWWIGAEMRPSHDECLDYGKMLVSVSAGKEGGHGRFRKDE